MLLVSKYKLKLMFLIAFQENMFLLMKLLKVLFEFAETVRGKSSLSFILMYRREHHDANILVLDDAILKTVHLAKLWWRDHVTVVRWCMHSSVFTTIHCLRRTKRRPAHAVDLVTGNLTRWSYISASHFLNLNNWWFLCGCSLVPKSQDFFFLLYNNIRKPQFWN